MSKIKEIQNILSAMSDEEFEYRFQASVQLWDDGIGPTDPKELAWAKLLSAEYDRRKYGPQSSFISRLLKKEKA